MIRLLKNIKKFSKTLRIPLDEKSEACYIANSNLFKFFLRYL
jgi:hypothetical protein